MSAYGKNMAAAKGKKPAGGKIPSRKQVAEKMDALGGEDPGEAGQTFDYGDVIGLLDRILAIEPGNRNALNIKGMMLMGMGENDKALACYKAILKANPADKEALNNAGIAMFGLGKVPEALKYVDKAIELDRRYPDALMNKAVILHGLGRTEEARTFMMRAQALDSISS